MRFPAEWRESAIGKPPGFWYDVGLDWLRWLEGEGYFDSDGWMRPYLYEVEIDASRLLLIHDLETLDTFSREYQRPLMEGLHTKVIDWKRVAEKHAGVEIAPYFWPGRLHVDYFWYYGWDCASGVVWQPEGVKSIALKIAGKEKIIEFYRQNQPGDGE